MAYYGFTNKNIQKEVEGNRKGHIIFNLQRLWDMDRLEELLKDQNKIYIDFATDWWNVYGTFYYDIKDKDERLKAGRQYVTAKILKALEKKYPQLSEYKASRTLEVFKNRDIEEYKKKSKGFYGLEELKEILSLEGITIDRIHFIMKGTESPVLHSALAILLSNETPFNVTFYCAPSRFGNGYDPDSKDKTLLTEKYLYTYFNAGEKGLLSYAAKRAAEKERRKQKKKDKKNPDKKGK